jgi:hypothetical protein
MRQENAAPVSYPNGLGVTLECGFSGRGFPVERFPDPPKKKNFQSRSLGGLYAVETGKGGTDFMKGDFFDEESD